MAGLKMTLDAHLIVLQLIITVKIVLISFAYLGIKLHRPDEYYLTPLRDFLERASSNTNIQIYTRPEHVNRLNTILSRGTIIGLEPETLMAEIWPEPKALEIYHRLIRNNPSRKNSSQAKYLRLIAVWLGKLAAMRRAFLDGADACFWFDAGHWVSVLCHHKVSQYAFSLQNEIDFTGLTDRLADHSLRYGIMGCERLNSRPSFHMPMSWMHEYIANQNELKIEGLQFSSGVFLLIHRQYAEKFFDRYSYWWERLISDGKAGTEENAITLVQWEQQYKMATYCEWMDHIFHNKC